jgi:FKBP-type peptidyl-prolyl cis-trans isomerase
MRSFLVAGALALLPVPALAQDAAADPSQDRSWHNAQSLALAQRAAEGWYALPGGALWRRVAGDGTGAHPTVADVVTVHYAGTFIDGREFDSSAGGPPATFPLQGLIPAWQLAIPQAGIGDTIEIAAPATLAYGPVSRGGPIPGGATLLFRVELLAIAGR